MPSITGNRHARLRLAALLLLVFVSVCSPLARPSAPSADTDTLGPAARLHVQLVTGAGAGSGGWLMVGDVGSYAGTLTFEQTGGHMAVVNGVSLEDYVRGISEMPRDWPMPSLQAQAVAARTYGLYKAIVNANRGSLPGTDDEICATDSCQVYRGLPDGPASPRWAAAVASTAGQVLMYRGGVIEAFYAASNGGRTRSGSVPWLPAVDDPDDAISPYHHWTWSAPVAGFAHIVGVPAAELVALSTTADGVVATLRQPPGPGTTDRRLDWEQFKAGANRELPSPPGLPLALPGPYFSLTTQPPGTVQVEGWGFGHGLGMSQYGALGKALRGLSAGAILAAYYGPARPTKLSPRKIPAEVRVLVSSDRSTATVVGSGPLEVVDDQGRPLGQAPTGALSLEVGASGVLARVIARPAVTNPPQPPPAPGGRLRAFADLRAPVTPPTGAPPAPPAPPPSTPAAQAAVTPAANVPVRPPGVARIPPLVTTGARSGVLVTSVAAGGVAVVALSVLAVWGVRRVRRRGPDAPSA
ncbi:MAG TPA: SpoIID/LytB domain-containing protein [Candidatus Dormibacteraeota bacterium]|nr:SpoIID/LytB domain-containing protein [Candidatus Dormibacteraeota bacterium]